MSRDVPPRDAIAATDLWVPVDATGEDFYALGERFGSQAGVLHRRHDATGQPFAKEDGAGFLEPYGLRWHRLQRQTRHGLDDNRLSIQVVNDYEAEYDDARPGDAPFGQPEFFTSLNRTTREADTRGRVALPSSHRRIIDSEDQRYALALTCRSVPLAAASASHPDQQIDVVETVPDGIVFRQAGTTTGTHGSVTQSQPSVSIGGVTFFGQAAMDAAKAALAQGGSVSDAARWASAAARNLPRPPLQDASGQEGAGSTRTRDPVPPPDTNAEGSVPLLDHPAGYVWSLAGRVGLLGTLVCPEGAHGHYFTGREGTRIGPLPIRHDAQITMGEDCVGRMVFVQDDAAQIPDGTGKLIKGELWADSSRANQDTALGHETVQFRPVVRVDADLPPSKPPPDPPPWTWVDPGRDEDDDDDDEEGGGPGGRGGGPGGGPRPPRGGGGGPGESSGEEPDTIGVIPGGTFRRVEPGAGGELTPVTGAGSQARDYSGPGEPCPNATAGTFVPSTGVFVATGTPIRIGGLPIHRVPGGYIQYSGHPGLTRVAGGLVIGGEEASIPLGLPAPARGGVVVDPAPDGVPHGRRVPGDDPGNIPLGLPGGDVGGVVVQPAPDDGVPHGRRVPGDDPGRIPLGLPGGAGAGFGFEPPPGGDRGVPRGWAERQERRAREDRARRAREAREKAEREEIERLRDLEQRARERGQSGKGDRIQRARERLERQRSRREERQRRRDEYKERKQRERDERRRQREERERKRKEERDAERARRNRRREDERERRRREGASGSPPQGGYMIDVTDEGAEVLTTGRLPDEERRRLEEDEARRRRARESQFGDWNAANRPTPFFGSPGGPRSLEDWAHVATYGLRAMQRVVNGAFGGPSYLAANIGVVHRNTPDNLPAGSRLGAHWSVLPGERDLQVCGGEAVVEVVSGLEAGPGQKICACSGAVLRVARQHAGTGQIDDLRPLVLLDNGDADGREVKADLFSDVQRRVFADRDRAFTAAQVRAQKLVGERGAFLEVVRVDPRTRVIKEQLVDIDETGLLAARSGARVNRVLTLEPGTRIELHGDGDLRLATLTLSPQGLRLSVGNEELHRGLVLSPKGLLVEGDLILKGQLLQTS